MGVNAARAVRGDEIEGEWIARCREMGVAARPTRTVRTIKRKLSKHEWISLRRIA
jgi:hypothetical protein